MNEPLHPFRWLPPRPRIIAFVLALVGTVVVMVAMGVLGGGLVTEEAPGGIVTYEFAGDLATVERILDGWGEQGRVLAGVDLGLDYLFLVAYSCCLALGCALAVPFVARSSTVLAWLVAGLSWGQLLAGLLDAVENAALTGLLLGARHAALPGLAWWCAAGKFTLVALGLLFLLLVSVAATIARLRRPARAGDG